MKRVSSCYKHVSMRETRQLRMREAPYMRLQHALESFEKLVLLFWRKGFNGPADVDVEDHGVVNEVVWLGPFNQPRARHACRMWASIPRARRRRLLSTRWPFRALQIRSLTWRSMWECGSVYVWVVLMVDGG